MTDSELEDAVPAIRHNLRRTLFAVLIIALVVGLVALLAFVLHAYLAPSPKFNYW